MKKMLIAVVALGLCAGSSAQTSGTSSLPSPVTHYRISTGMTAMTCELMGSTFMMSLSSADNPAKCIEDARATSSDEFKAAARALTGKAQEAFKDFHIAHLAYLNALAPDVREQGRRYEARVRSARAKADEMWTRLEMEIQLGS